MTRVSVNKIERRTAAPDTTLVPADVKAKLRRLICLKEQLSAAAWGEARGAEGACATKEACGVQLQGQLSQTAAAVV